MTLRRNWLLGAAAVAAGVGGAGIYQWRASSDVNGKTEKPSASHASALLQAYRFMGLDGKEQGFEVYAGQPLLINFWATWCTPCIEEMPMLSQFYQAHQASGLRMLGLAVDQANAVKAFLKRQPVAYDIGLAGMGGLELAKALGNGQSGGLPFSALLNAKGQVVQTHTGRLQQPQLAQWLLSLK